MGKSIDHVGWTFYFNLPYSQNTVGMKQEKRTRYIKEFEEALERGHLAQKEVHSIQGKLANLSQIFVAFKEGVRAGAKLGSQFDRGRIKMVDLQKGDKAARKFAREVGLAIKLLHSDPRIELNWVARELPLYPWAMATDASSLALGGWVTVEGVTRAWRERVVDLLKLVPAGVKKNWLTSKPKVMHINNTEFISIVGNVLMALPHIQGQTVQMLCDNKTAKVWGSDSGCRPAEPFGVVSGFLDWLQTGANFRLEIVWLSTVANTAADAISRPPFTDEIWIGGEPVAVERNPFVRDIIRRCGEPRKLAYLRVFHAQKKKVFF